MPILKKIREERNVRHLSYNKVTLTLAGVAIFLVGMLRDPDLAKGDDLDGRPVAHDAMPGYQCSPEQAQPLSQIELAKLNTPTESGYPTF